MEEALCTGGQSNAEQVGLACMCGHATEQPIEFTCHLHLIHPSSRSDRLTSWRTAQCSANHQLHRPLKQTLDAFQRNCALHPNFI
ncbi:hypothetical protein TcWFU_009282 [Taenia crassiceps]|uniref:Uncharacterized protein n=1 Tax=Taenia crassiceps TaxID=6207 RepID=A0ABR4QIS0_9CEST